MVLAQPTLPSPHVEVAVEKVAALQMSISLMPALWLIEVPPAVVNGALPAVARNAGLLPVKLRLQS